MFNDVVIAARLFAQASVKSPPKLEDGRTERKEGRERGNCTAAGVFDKVQARRCQCATRVGALPDTQGRTELCTGLKVSSQVVKLDEKVALCLPTAGRRR